MTPVFASFLLLLGGVAGFCAAVAILRKRDNLRARFLSFVAHEINTPITALNMTVLNFVQGTFGPISAQHEPWIKLIKTDVYRLASMVGELRDLIHLDFHRDLTLNLERTDISKLISEAVEDYRDGFERAKIPLIYRCGESAVEVEADPDRLKRCVNSFFEHARKFRMKGDVVAEFTVTGNEARFSVNYGGEKRSPADVSQALDLYYPVHNPTAQVLSGVGLGLGMPNALIEMHGGKMKLTVDPDGQTEISFVLPGAGRGRDA